MADFAVRVLTEDTERRAVHSLLRVALHSPPMSDSDWETVRPTYGPKRFFGAFDGDVAVGSSYVYDTAVAVPGGNVVPIGGLARVGVRADYRRRGVMTELMRFQLADSKANGHVLSTLHASEAAIYGRFGYGMGTRSREIRLNRPRVRAGVPRSGHVRMLSSAEAIDQIAPLYSRIGLYRTGMMTRTRDWWSVIVEAPMRTDQPYLAAVHSGPDGDDGYVLYKAKDNSDDASNDYGATLEVWDLIGANQAARNDLWRFLMEIDLVMRIDAYARPVDEPVELLLENPRSCVTRNIDDESWVRLIDVQAALAARTYGDADPVAVEVNDAFMPENSGTYLISRDGVTRGTEQAQLTLDVDTLGMLYFGAWKPTDLATSGRIKVFDADALARADRLFEADSIPWCGTHF
ncbi:GNAT family N-acetyltransferase [Kibdelosporangium philippinense]|uniref:GNAT family N-acetyltransferase n=1 Tax=Kibdelosporangium philippinense TaxID=211113 RepID=A0ABS8Z8M0_9PSEU|nr:GNAT family N-acetyltransferase [Kibdelosporangium philippinense]MCE7003429.1 GNAT family N-acetyltransferase [Kibdelosporangium philippinense]